MATYTIITNQARWNGLAVRGEILAQGHEISVEDALKIAKTGPPITNIEKITARAANGHRPGRWPETINRIRESEKWSIIE